MDRHVDQIIKQWGKTITKCVYWGEISKYFQNLSLPAVNVCAEHRLVLSALLLTCHKYELDSSSYLVHVSQVWGSENEFNPEPDLCGRTLLSSSVSHFNRSLPVSADVALSVTLPYSFPPGGSQSRSLFLLLCSNAQKFKCSRAAQTLWASNSKTLPSAAYDTLIKAHLSGLL